MLLSLISQSRPSGATRAGPRFAARVAKAAAMVAAVILAGCANRATGVLHPVAVSVPGAKEVSLLVVTTRAPTGIDDGVLFGGERGRGLSLLEIGVSIPPNHKTGEVEWPESLPPDPSRHFATTRVRHVDRQQAPAAFRARLAATGRKHVLVFVHGFNNRFEDAVYRFAQIVHDSEAAVTPVLFTWPSRGKAVAYVYDRESANFSRDALESVLQALAREPGVSEVSVLAHSMGNWVALEALRQMAIRNGSVPAKIRNVMLASPDVDIDVAGTQLRGMGARPPKLTLFVSQDDRALAASNLLGGGIARLGAIDPNKEPYRTALERYGVTVLDLTQLREGDRLHHGKFAASPDVVRFIGRRLMDGQQIGGAREGLGDGITQALSTTATLVGHVAGAVVTAPIAVIDPATRDTLEDRLRSAAGAEQPAGAVGAVEPVELGPPKRRR